MLCHNYIFLAVQPSFHLLSMTKRELHKEYFLKQLKKKSNVVINTYATLGLKTNTHILLWLQADSLEEIQILLNKLMHTSLGKYLVISYTLVGLTRPTQYSNNSTKHLHTESKGKQYLVIYPFSKTKEWYFLDFEKRKKIMNGHIGIGKKYPQIQQLLLYSYGIDDNEFILSYETNDLSLFQNLVIELRSDATRAYTLKDTPIFTCIAKSSKEVLEFL